MEEVRTPAVAGLFYPGDKEHLERTVTELLVENIPHGNYENVIGVVAPHAGYPYSGKSAAYAYNVLKDLEFNKAIIISPSHREYFEGCSIYCGDAFRTPLGDVPIAKELKDNIIKNGKYIIEGYTGHREEHAIEVHLPFLQMIKRGVEIVPIVMGDQRGPFVNDLATAILEAYDSETIIIASSDLSHFHSKEIAGMMDSLIMKRVSDFDYEKLLEDLAERNSEACGGGAIAVLMKVADFLGRRKTDILSYTDSSEVTGDDSGVVGYMSAVFYG